MVDVVYRIVEHDGGWAYKAGDVFSETFPTREAAQATADAVAAEQRVPGDDVAISWEDEAGRWHDEVERGSDRPEVRVEPGETRNSAVAGRTPLVPDLGSGGVSGIALTPLLTLAGAAAAGYLFGSMFHRRT